MNPTEFSDTGLYGAIAMAVYEPDPELFGRQLRSIRDQTVRHWSCVIAVDGDPGPIREMVGRMVPGDERFVVVGDGSRLGFYANFERALIAVPARAHWIALSDQDDLWHADKLATLLPRLVDHELAAGQARLVAHPSGEVIGRTSRVDHGPDFVLLENQYSGATMVFRADLLQLALPFPRVSTRTAAHDHWIAVCAGARGGACIVDQELQDYVQHDRNVFGDPALEADRGSGVSVRRMLTSVRHYEGRVSPRAMLRWYYWSFLGWRQVLADALRHRAGARALTPRATAALSGDRRWRELNELLRAGRDAGVISPRAALDFRISWIAGALSGGRGAACAAAVLRPGSP